MGSYSRTGYLAIKKETSENVGVKPNVFIPFLSEDIVTEWGGVFSKAIVASRAMNYRPIDRAIPAPSGTITLHVEPVTFGHFLLGAGGAVTTGRYLPITSVVGTFTVGETITGGSSGATTTVTALSSEGDYILSGAFVGSFTDGETITGGSSGATAALTKADTLAYGHQFVMPQVSLSTTYTIELGFDNEAYRYTGVRFHNITWNQVDNVITAEVSVSARTEFKMGRVTAVTASGAGSKTVTVDQTTGLAASDTVKVFRPSTGLFLDFSAASVKTHTINAVSSETAFTITNLETSLAVGDVIVLAPQTPSYSTQKEFVWAGGALAKIGADIDTVVAASTGDNIEDFEISLINNVEPKHAAMGSNTKHRFPAVVYTAGMDGTGSLTRTYTDMTYLDRMRSERKFALQIKVTGAVMATVADFTYILDIRVPDGRLQPFNPSFAEDDLLNQEMPFQMFNSTSDGYMLKVLLVNESTSY